MTIKPLIVLMEFPDYKHTDLEKKEHSLSNGWDGYAFTPKLYSKIFYGEDDYTEADGHNHMTAAHYFSLESGDTFDLKGSHGDIYGWYMAKKNIKYYGKNLSKYGDRKRASNLVIEAMENLSKENIDLSKYDLNKDGIIDCLIIIHAGKGEQWNNSLGSYAIWPFFNKFPDINDGKYHNFRDSKGKIWKIDKFSVMEEDLTSDLFIHEMGHFLGLSDLYQHDAPIKYWSVMANLYSGSIPGRFPSSMGAYPRFVLQKDFEEKGYNSNWANIKEYDLKEIKKNHQELLLFSSSDKKRLNIIKINLDEKSPESPKSKRYYLLEWRNPTEEGIDSGLIHTLEGISYYGGLLIWYVDENRVKEDGKPLQKLLNGSRFASIVDGDPSPVFRIEDETLHHHISNNYSMYDAAFSLRDTEPIIHNKKNLILYHEHLAYTPYFNSVQTLYPQYYDKEHDYLPDEDLKVLILEDYTSFGKISLFSHDVDISNHDFKAFVDKDHILIKSHSPYDLSLVMARIDSEDNIIDRKIIELEKLKSGLFQGTIPKPVKEWHTEYIRESRPNEYEAIYNNRFTHGWGIDIKRLQ
jgi:immune inhibitor A